MSMIETQLKARGIENPAVLEALRRVPRHVFVPEEQKPYAYEDRPLPIGSGQTISQPYIVAYMTEKLALQPHHRVLEIGTGCGYQSAVLSEIANEVYSLEYFSELAETAKANLREAGYPQVRVRQGNGHQGWPEAAPFDAILVTAAAHDVPPALCDQLADEGRMIIPLGKPGEIQHLSLLHRQGKKIHRHTDLPVRFVPFLD